MTITAAKRHSLPKSKFADPTHEKYPIDTKKRAKAALSYGARFASPKVMGRIKRMVHEDYPSIKQKSDRKSKPFGSMVP